LSKSQRATFARLIAVSTRNYYEALLRSEAPKLKGKTAEEISKVFEKHYSETAARRRRAGLFLHVIDYRTSLLKEARTQALQARHRDNFALLFYATFFEHWINGIIGTAAKWRGVTDKEMMSILREVPLRGKLTWVVRLLNLPRLKPSHVNKLLDLAEHRNAYVHYKWRPIEN